MTLKELEAAAGVTDRAAFWEPFAKIPGATVKDGKTRSNGLEAGIAQLRHMAAQAD